MPPLSPEWAGHLAYFHPRILAVEELLVDRAWSSAHNRIRRARAVAARRR
jgi:hypothetical protein